MFLKGKATNLIGHVSYTVRPFLIISIVIEKLLLKKIVIEMEMDEYPFLWEMLGFSQCVMGCSNLIWKIFFFK
jgi:hypothetical protein